MILTAIGGSCPSKAASNGLFVTFNEPGTGRLGSAGLAAGGRRGPAGGVGVRGAW